MAQKTLIDEGFDIPSLQKQQTLVINLFDEVEKKIKAVNDAAAAAMNNTTASGAAANSKAAADAMKEATESVKNYTNEYKIRLAELKLANEQAKKDTIESKKNYLEEATAIKAANEERKRTTVSKNEAANINAELANSYKQLELSAKASTDRYKQLAASLGLLHPLTVEAQKDALNLNTQLKNIDAGAGQYNRNVGNYSSATASLNNNIRVLATELPNAGISLRTFAQSLSNNIIPFVNSVKEVQASNKILQAEGKSTTSVLKTIGASLTSVSVITGVAVAAGLMLYEMWQKGSKASQAAEKSITKYKEALNNAEESERSAAQQQIARLNILTTLAADNAQSTRARTLAVEELQKTYPSTFGALEKQAILEGNLGDAVNKTTQALLDRAAAQAAEKKFAAASEKIYDLTLAQKEAQSKLIDEQKKLDELTVSASAKNASDGLRDRWVAQGSAVRSLKSDINGLSKELESARKEQNNFLKDAQESAAKAGDVLFNSTKTNDEKTPSKKIKDIGELAKKSKELTDVILEQMNNVSENEQVNIDRRLAAIRTELDEGLITIAEYQDKKKLIVKEGEDEILRLQLAALDDYMREVGLDADGRAKVQEYITTKTKEEIKRRQQFEEEVSLQKAKAREDDLKLFDDMFKEASNGEEKASKARLEREKRDADEAKRIEEEKYKYIQDIAQETTQLIFTLLDAQTQKQLSNLDKEKQALSDKYADDAEAINQSSLSEDEKAARKKVLLAEEAEQQEAIDNKIREIKRKQAVFDKAQTLANITFSTAQAIMAAVAAFPITGGMPFSAIAAAIGAVQAATVLATPIPEYAKGKKETDSYEGLAIYGEKGTELLIDKSGKMKVASEPTLFYTQKGDRVLSNKELKQALKPSQDGMVNKISYDELIRANAAQMDAQTKKIVNTLKETNRPVDITGAMRLELASQRSR